MSGKSLNFLLLAGVMVMLAACAARPINCLERPDDATGYLESICRYVVDNEINVTPGNPAEYNILRVEQGEYEGQPALVVWLDCCYMGDRAFIDEESGEVIGFSLGAK
jgi:hypothetical protein